MNIYKESQYQEPNDWYDKKYGKILVIIFFIIAILLNLILINQRVYGQIIIDSGYHLKTDNGVYIDLGGNWQNNGVFQSDNQSFVRLSGGQQEISGNTTTRFANLIIDGTAHKSLINLTTQKTEVANSLVFNYQKIVINQNDLVLLSGAVITNANNQKFVVTNNMGRLIKNDLQTLNNFLFPVGSSLLSYTPVLLNLNNNPDTLAVRVIDGVSPNDSTCVQKTYLIKASDTLTTADISVAWNTPDEGSAFVGTQAMMWQQDTGQWMLIPDIAGAVANTPETNWKYQAHNVSIHSLTTDSFIVKNVPPPLIISNPLSASVCENGTVYFSVSASGYGVLSYQWQVNCSGSWNNISNGGLAPLYAGANDSILTVSNVPYTSSGCLFRCVVTALGGSISSNPASLQVFPLPIVYISGDTSLCEGETTVLTVFSTAQQYVWSTGETTQSIEVFPFPPSQNYSVTVTDDNSCVNTAQTVVHVTANFNVLLSSNFEPDHTIYLGQSITFTASPPGYDVYAFVINSDTIRATASNILAYASLINNAQVSVVAYVNGCIATDSLKVIVKPLPNAFTPFDKNGKNDKFVEGLDLVIINRWGQLIYEGVDGWDGTYKGKVVSPGTYFYNITFNKNTQEAFIIKGSVLVVADNN